MAVGAMNALLDQGYRIPQDVSLHGFDNLELSAYLHPALTTVDLPLREIGRGAALTMDGILSGNPPAEHGQLIPCAHIPRGTVRELPAGEG